MEMAMVTAKRSERKYIRKNGVLLAIKRPGDKQKATGVDPGDQPEYLPETKVLAPWEDPRKALKSATGCWPQPSESMAITCGTGKAGLARLQADIARQQSRLAKFGVKTDYELVKNDKGDVVCARPVMRDVKHRSDHMKCIGIADGDAGYRDAQPGDGHHWQGL
jgi:hypothetical protein